MSDVLLTEDELLLRSSLRELADKELAPRASHYDQNEEFPWENLRRMAAMGTQIEAARTLMLAAASCYDQDRSANFLPYLQAKVACSEAAVRVTQDLMTSFGGTAFARRLTIERYFRDARAGLVMGMANDVAYQNMIPLMFPES